MFCRLAICLHSCLVSAPFSFRTLEVLPFGPFWTRGWHGMLHERAVKEAGLAVVKISVIDLYSVTRAVAKVQCDSCCCLLF